MIGKEKFMGRIILASGSPRRREILAGAGVKFEVLALDHKEDCRCTEPEELVKELAGQKAEAAAEFLLKKADLEEAALVIGADTVVAKDGKILGKPGTKEEAFSMLSLLQGSSHQVFTGVSLAAVAEGKILEKFCFAEETKVHVVCVEDEELRAYIATGEPMDKAGGYAIQGKFGRYIEGIEGDYYNVVGFPLCRFFRELKKQKGILGSFLDKTVIP